MSIIPIELEMETTASLKAGDEFESKWSANFLDAREQMLDNVDNILMEIEDWVHPIEATVDIVNVLNLADGIERIKAMRYYTYRTRVIGKHVDYDEDFDYDFTDIIRSVLQDRISCEILVGGK